jgi:hypothetical protein
LMLASMYSTFRYGFWRISYTVKFFLDPGNSWSYLDAFFIWVLVGPETHAFVILFLGFMQTLWPLRRTPYLCRTTSMHGLPSISSSPPATSLSASSATLLSLP